jgi:hypothetical protein
MGKKIHRRRLRVTQRGFFSWNRRRHPNAYTLPVLPIFKKRSFARKFLISPGRKTRTRSGRERKGKEGGERGALETSRRKLRFYDWGGDCADHR